MKNLDISLTSIDGLDCMDGLIITLLEWLGRDYDLLLGEMWDFSFDEEKNGTMGEKIVAHSSINLKSLKEQCGVSLHREKASDNSISIIKNRLLSTPVILIIDMFWCPWTRNFFQKEHAVGHVIMATGYNESGFYCLDYSPRNEKVVFPFSYCQEGLASYMIPEIHSPPTITNKNWRDVVKRSISVIDEHKIFENMRAFSRYINESFNPAEENQTYGGLERNPFIWRMDRIAKSRELFSGVLMRLSNEENIIELANRLNLAKTMWTTIKNLLIKSCIDGDRRLVGRIAKRIDAVADYEESIFHSLKQLYENETALLSQHDKFKEQNFVCVDLDKHVNCRAFQNDSSEIIPDLTGDGAFILVDERIQEERLFYKDIVCFKLYNILRGTYDNITCQGQTIELPIGSYREVYLLGCSINGNFRKNLVVHYSDGYEQRIEIAFADFYPPAAEFDQEVAWAGVCSKDRNKNSADFECELYVQNCKLISDKHAISLRLPECPNMHIFSIVLIE